MPRVRASKNTSRALDVDVSESALRASQKRRERWAEDLPAFAAECLYVIDRDEAGIEPDRKVPLIYTPSQLHIHSVLTRFEQFNLARTTALHELDPTTPITKLPIKVRVLKARKIRATTYFQSRMFHRCEFVAGTHALTMAHEMEPARNIANMIAGFHSNWAERDLDRVPITRTNDELAEWIDPHSSRIFVKTAGSKGKGSSASYTYQMNHFSEDALYPDNTEQKVSALAATTKYCEQYFESTARGENHFKTAWDTALWIDEVERYWRNREPFPDTWNGEVKIFWGWWQDAGYQIPLLEYEEDQIRATLDKNERDGMDRYAWTLPQIKWRRDKLNGEAKQQTDLAPLDYFKREYPSDPEEAFVAKSGKAFSREPLLAMQSVQKHIYKALEAGVRLNGMPYFVGNLTRDASLPEQFKMEPLVKAGPITERMMLGANLVIWRPPSVTKAYLMATDTAEGLDHGDDSTCALFDRTNGFVLVEAARYIAKATPEELAEIAFFLGKMFNDAYSVNERGPHGRATCVRLVNLGYANMYHYKNVEQFVDKANPYSFTAGFNMSPATKPALVASGEIALRDNSLILYHKKAIEQWLMYQNDDGHFSAPPGKNDDCVVTDLLAIHGNMPGNAPPVWVGRPREIEIQTDPDGAPLTPAEEERRYWTEQLKKVRTAETDRKGREVRFHEMQLADFKSILD